MSRRNRFVTPAPDLAVLFAATAPVPALTGLWMLAAATTGAARMWATRGATLTRATSRAARVRGATTGARSWRSVVLNLRLRARGLSVRGLVVHRGFMARWAVRARSGR